MIVSLRIDLLKQPRPCIPAKLVRCATGRAEIFFQRMSLEISCSPKTGPVRHFKRAGKKLVGSKLLSTHMSCTRRRSADKNTSQVQIARKGRKVLHTAWSDLIFSGYDQRAA